VAYVDRVNISVAGPAIRRELALSPLELGFIFSAFAYPYAVMQIAGGWAADRFGPRLVLIVLSALWAAGTMLTGASWAGAPVVGRRVVRGVSRARRHWRRRRVSSSDAGIHLVAPGPRTRLRAGYHAQLRAARRRRDASRRTRHHHTIRLAGVVRLPRCGKPRL